MRTHRTFLGLTALLLAGAAFCPVPLAAQRCGHWVEVLIQSFLPQQPDEKLLREMAGLSPEQYFEAVKESDKKALSQLAGHTVNIADVDFRLRRALERFYNVGYELYGARLDPDNLVIVDDMSVNAFATGSLIAMNRGTIEYFTNPVRYLMEVGAFPRYGYTAYQYNFLVSNFEWQNDWESIYFILAHEAAHNLMRHRDERIWRVVLENYSDYRKAIIDHRKDIAHGRAGGGVKRYLWRSLSSFLEDFGQGSEFRRVESEADVVAMLLLKKAGFDPGVANVAGQRMARLVGPAVAGGWQQVMTEALCSSHPDWIQRIAEMQRTQACVRFSDNLCEGHIAYPVERMLTELKNGMSQLGQYYQETLSISEGQISDSVSEFEVKIEVKPKDAGLFVDGEKVLPGKLQVRVGPHDLAVSKEGYESFTGRLVVFPDVQPKLKIKLKKKKK